MSDSDMFYCSFVSIHYIICECGETFPSDEDLKVHLEREHTTQKKDKTEYRCGICDAPFDNEHDCIEHYESAHIGIQEEHDYVEVYSQEEVDKDIKDEDLQNAITKPHKVTNVLSDKIIITPENSTKISKNEMKILKSAMKISENDDDICFDDIKEEVSYDEASTEYPIPRPVKKQVKKSKTQYNKKNVVCEVCGKKYASNAALRYHQRVHTGERPYKCTECTKCFTMPLFLQIHLRTHTGERPYACPHCPKAFSNKAALIRHNRVHTGAKPYECPQCGKFFTQSNSMKLHVNTVHLKMPAPYKSKSRRNKQKEREMQREVILTVIEDAKTDEVHSISEQSNMYIKPEVIYKQEVEEDDLEVGEQEVEEDVLEVGEQMVTYDVIYEVE